MIKNVLFLIPIFVVSVLLTMFETTGMKAHIILSVAGLLVLVAYTVATKKSWKNPSVEIVGRVFYAVALITGIVLMNVHGVAVVSIIHKVCATLFAIVFGVNEIYKIIKKLQQR